MSRFPTAIDDASSLFSPADAFSTEPLETITTMLVQANDSTISVESAGGGFAEEYGILSIDDELIVYTAKTAAQFTGCQRGAFGTVAAQHTAGATVRANMVAAYIEKPSSPSSRSSALPPAVTTSARTGPSPSRGSRALSTERNLAPATRRRQAWSGCRTPEL